MEEGLKKGEGAQGGGGDSGWGKVWGAVTTWVGSSGGLDRRGWPSSDPGGHPRPGSGLLGDIVVDPVQVVGDTGVDARPVGLGTALLPADHARLQLGAIHLADQGPSRVTLGRSEVSARWPGFGGRGGGRARQPGSRLWGLGWGTRSPARLQPLGVGVGDELASQAPGSGGQDEGCARWPGSGGWGGGREDPPGRSRAFRSPHTACHRGRFESCGPYGGRCDIPRRQGGFPLRGLPPPSAGTAAAGALGAEGGVEPGLGPAACCFVDLVAESRAGEMAPWAQCCSVPAAPGKGR